MAARKLKVSTTGYKENSKDKNLKELYVPSPNLTMTNVNRRVKATPVYENGSYGVPITMMPGVPNYSFPGAVGVIEKKLRKAQLVGEVPPEYETVNVTDPNDPAYQEYLYLQNLYNWSNIQDYDRRHELAFPGYYGVKDGSYTLFPASEYSNTYDNWTNLPYNDFTLDGRFNDNRPRSENYNTDETGYYGSKANRYAFNTKAELDNFIATNRGLNPSMYSGRGSDHSAAMQQIIDKYTPIGYDAMVDWNHPLIQYNYRYSGTPDKQIFKRPITPVLEDEIDREALRKIYPGYSDEEINEVVAIKRLTPQYVTNTYGNDGTQQDISFDNPNEDPNYVHPSVVKQQPYDVYDDNGDIVGKTNASPYDWSPNAGVTGYLPEGFAAYTQSQRANYLPRFGTPESYLGKKYVYTEPEKVQESNENYTLHYSGNPGVAYVHYKKDNGDGTFTEKNLGATQVKDWLDDEQQKQFHSPSGGTARVNYNPNAKMYTDVKDAIDQVEDFREQEKRLQKRRKNEASQSLKFQKGGPSYQLPPQYRDALQNFVYPIIDETDEYTGYNPLQGQINQDTRPGSIENNDWWMQHELLHHLQNLSGEMSSLGPLGKRPNLTTASNEAIEGYYDRRDNDVNRTIDNMIAQDPSLQFIPRDKLRSGSEPDENGHLSFVGAENLQYEDPSTLEGEARQYEQYIKEGNSSIFPNKKNGGAMKKVTINALPKAQSTGQLSREERIKNETDRQLRAQQATAWDPNDWNGVQPGPTTYDKKTGKYYEQFYDERVGQFVPREVIIQIKPKSYGVPAKNAPKKTKEQKQAEINDKYQKKVERDPTQFLEDNPDYVIIPGIKGAVLRSGLDPETLKKLDMEKAKEEFVKDLNSDPLQQSLGTASLDNPVTNAAAERYADYKVNNIDPGKTEDQMFRGYKAPNTRDFYQPNNASNTVRGAAALGATAAGVTGLTYGLAYLPALGEAVYAAGAANPFMQATGAALTASPAALPGASLANLANAYFITHGVMSAPETYRAWDNAINNGGSYQNAIGKTLFNLIDFGGLGAVEGFQPAFNYMGKAFNTAVKYPGQLYNNVATGNSRLTDLGIRAWKSPAVGLSQEASADMFNSLLNSGKMTPVERNIVLEYQHNNSPFTGRYGPVDPVKRSALNDIISKYELQFPQNSNVIATRRFSFDKAGKSTLGADVQGRNINFGDRPTSFSAGLGLEGYQGAPDRLVIPSRYLPKMKNNFIAQEYSAIPKENLELIGQPSMSSRQTLIDFGSGIGTSNEIIGTEKELIGTGLNFKQIGKVKNDIGGFDVIVKPRTTAEAFKAASTRSAAGESGSTTLDKWPTLFGKKSAGPVNTPLGPQAELDLANARAKAFSESAFNKLKLQRFRPGQTFDVSNQEARFMDDPELAKMYNDYYAMKPDNPSTFIEWFKEGHGQYGPSGRYGTNAFGDTNDLLAINKVNDVGAPAKNILLDAGHEATHSRSLRLKSTQAERDIAMDAWQPMVDVNMANNNQWSIGPANGFNQAAEEAFAVQNELRTFLNDFDGLRVYTHADIPEIQSALQKLASEHPYLTQDAANLIDIKKLIKSLNVIGLGVTVPLLINATKEQKKRGGRIKNVDFIASRNKAMLESLPKAQTMGEVPYEIAAEPYRDPKISRDSYDREYYDPMTETIHMKPSYPNVIHEAMVKDHESEHHNQKLKGRMSSTEYWPGPLKEPVIGASADMIYPYYNRATQDVYNLMGAAPQSTLFGIPEDVAVMGFQDKTYDTPGTAEYEAEHVSREPRTLYMGDPVVENAIDKTLGRQRQDPEMMFKDKYNTELTKEEQKDFDKWVAKESKQQGRDIMMDKGAYDIQGFWKSGDWKKRDADNHGTDTWKKPNHPTFSNESKYHGADGWYGGNWEEDAGYQPSKQTFNTYGPDYYNWMFGNEPNRPEHLDMSRYISGENYGFPITYEQGGNVRRVKIKSLPKNWKNQ